MDDDKIETLLNDCREIKSIHFHHKEGGYTAGHGLRLRAYGEDGLERSWLPYIAVVLDGEVVARIPAQFVEIRYQKFEE